MTDSRTPANRAPTTMRLIAIFLGSKYARICFADYYMRVPSEYPAGQTTRYKDMSGYQEASLIASW